MTILSDATNKLLTVSVSGKFQAILDALLDVQPRRTEPALAEVTITSDGFLLGREEGDIGFNAFIGSKRDLIDNINGVAEVADLTNAELNAVLGRVEAVCA